MIIRRRVTLRATVIETGIVDDAAVSPAALGLYCYLASASDGQRSLAEICDRFRIEAAAASAWIAELQAAGLIDGAAS